MPSNTDNARVGSNSLPKYEKRDTNVRTVIIALVSLGIVVVMTLFASWGVFRYFAATETGPASASPFVGVRQLPTGPQLQVHPREDYLRFHDDQEHSLETYAWENRANGIVRVPIDRAMELLLQKGLPVVNQNPAAPSQAPSKGDAKQ